MNALVRRPPARLHLVSLLLLAATWLTCTHASPNAPGIDREALLQRHNPRLVGIQATTPLTVGNGGFAFSVDATGLQTFQDLYQASSMPLETLSRWAWVSDENPKDFTLSDAMSSYRLADGRDQNYPTDASGEAGQWMRRNPHDLPLGVLSLFLDRPDGLPLAPGELKNPAQELDLRTGIICSRYQLEGEPVTVWTACSPASDTVSVEILSPLVDRGLLGLKLAFPLGHDARVKNTPPLDWSAPETHASALVSPECIQRKVGELSYKVITNGIFSERAKPHEFLLQGKQGKLAVTLSFERDGDALTSPPSAAAVRDESSRHWTNFWRRSAMLDLSGSTDPRAALLEERVILSQYLCAIQLAGEFPPQESGLQCSTWYGKHHTEMIWWHAAHFALWGQTPLLEKNLEWYHSRLPVARNLAKERQLLGARWSKMVGPEGRESPGGNPLIIWNQPHPIYLCELVYRDKPSRETLSHWSELVFETADCLASMATKDTARGVFVLGPPLWIAQEIHDPRTSQNPCFELAYWAWALETAQRWRERLGLPRKEQWEVVAKNLAPLPVNDGKYVALESTPDTWTNLASRHDHPEMLMAFGFLPATPKVDKLIMARTLEAVLTEWDWETKIWGWDYPMIAMTATRLGRPELAVESLLRDGPNNHYQANGNCPQRGDTALLKGMKKTGMRPEIGAYLPANGALLSAVALMIAGWEGCETTHPGFPKDGTWVVRSEGWKPLP